jgi:RHS repeat-associated protein
MKKIYTLFLVLPVLVLAQSQDQNYIKTTTYKVETNSSIEDPQPNQASVTIQYFDGLGRPIQQVAHKQSNTGKDIIVHTEYDLLGRQEKEFLPYVRGTASKDYDGSAQSNVMTFYSTNTVELTGNPYFETTGNPYSQKELESSPLSRVFKQAAPGDPWALDSGKEVKFEYQTNIENEVMLFKVNTNLLNGIYEPTLVQGIGFYNPNQLYKTITKDENWTSGQNNTTEEFKNKKGQVVLKRTYNEGDNYDTYYVYDKFGNLTFVIPPKVDVEETISSTHLEGLCYQYKYDHRNRLAEKKLPGKQWEFIVYDKLDRVVATGPAFSPYGSNVTGWLITKYDVFSRMVYTGWKSQDHFDATKRKELQDQLTNSSLPLFESKTTSPNSINNISVNYTSDAFPTAGFELLTVNYYDNYNFPGAPEAIPDFIDGQEVLDNVKSLPTGSWTRFLETSNETTGEISYTIYDKKARPIQTKTVNHLGGYTEITNELDFEGKTLNTNTIHKRDGEPLLIHTTDRFTYSAQGKLISQVQNVNENPTELIVANEYDELGQLISKNVGGQDTENFTGIQKVDYKYNIRGWLKEINDVNDLTISQGSYIDLFSFKINYNELTATTNGNLHGVNTAYNGQVVPLYNGNIAEIYWKTSTDNVMRKYSYDYDHLNRLEKAHYQKPLQSIEQTGSYDEYLSYDKNGNIESLTRTGNLDSYGGTMEIDKLDYKYQGKSNLLMKVTDASNESLGFKDDSNGMNDTNDDYKYDENGNMTADENKGIGLIKYNHLNLPTLIDFGGGKNIQYFYNASGVKLKKVVTEGTSALITDYLGGFQYLNGNLQFFFQPEGYVNIIKHGVDVLYINYVYNYTDHLGNIRLSYGIDPETNVLKILEENHYYPFGLKHTNYNSDIRKYTKETDPITQLLKLKILPPTDGKPLEYKYKFQGQERQDELGLNWDSFKWRNYDYAIARFMSIDPLAEDYTYNSPYAFAENKVGMGRELEGCELGPFWSPMAGVMLETTTTPPLAPTLTSVSRTAVEVGVKTNEAVGKPEVITRISENFSRGAKTETEQLAKNGLEKNTQSFTRVDPKTGKEATTIPDAIKPEGSTVEIKNVQNQSLTRQLRVQKEISNEYGLKPELIINEGARLSKPLENAGFDIKTYKMLTPAIDNTGISRPQLPRRAAPKPKSTEEREFS